MEFELGPFMRYYALGSNKQQTSWLGVTFELPYYLICCIEDMLEIPKAHILRDNVVN